jgi:signal transduction histidine kinase
VQAHVRDPDPRSDVQQILRQALDDPRVAVAYWIEDRARWVSSGGQPAARDASRIDVARHGVPVVSVSFDDRRARRDLAAAAVAEARPELENERLRASLALQLVEVRQSRERIVAAQLGERRRIERNLHDGAQQRLLALAFQLRAADASGDHGLVRIALGDGVREIRLALAELRELANGLHPTILTDGGLGAALDDLARRTPANLRLNVTDDRYSPATEAAAWFIACEALTNAVKHANANTIDIRAHRQAADLVLVVEDDGVGGAQATGQGLRGIADRADASGGRLAITNRPGGGTTLTVNLPCES